MSSPTDESSHITIVLAGFATGKVFIFISKEFVVSIHSVVLF